MIRLIASDLDGTLLTWDDRITDSNKEAIRRFREAGIDLLLISGRDHGMLAPIIEQIGFPVPAIGFNGGVIFREDGSWVEDGITRLSLEACDLLEEFSRKYHCFYSAHGLTSNYTTMPEEESAEALTHTFMTYQELSRPKARQKALWYLSFSESNVVPYTDLRKAGIIKTEFYFPSPDLEKEISRQLTALADTACCITPYCSIELSHSSITKGNALRRFCRMRGYDLSEVAVLGDSGNDLSMFFPECLKIAMENADPRLKEIADFIAGHHNENGFSKGIDFILANRE